MSHRKTTTQGRNLASALQIPVLVLLFTGAAFYEALQMSALSDTDIWWHLRTGVWILQNHTVPHQGVFSQYASMPWIASSWGYDALLAGLYQLLGLRALSVVLMGFRVALAVLTFFLAGGRHGNFWAAVLVSAVTQYVSLALQPPPIFFSVLFFGIELALLFESCRSGSARPLFWLPPLFLLWANLHNEFVLGLGLLLLFLLATLISAALKILPAVRSTVSFGALAAVLVCSVLASLVTPYGIHLFSDLLKDAYSKAAFRYLPGMYPMGFRSPRDYVLALLVMSAFLILGHKRSWDLVKLSLMLTTTLIAFRMARDGWCAVLCAVAIIGEELAAASSRSDALCGGSATDSVVGKSFSKRDTLLSAVLVGIVFVAAAIHLPARTNDVMHRLEGIFPVQAADFIRANHLQHPLFNLEEWGGFLIWYLPEYPVSIDGRVDLYGDELLTRYLNVIGGGRLEAEPAFADAGTILLKKNSETATALMTIPSLSARYRVVYSDELAVVITPNGRR